MKIHRLYSYFLLTLSLISFDATTVRATDILWVNTLGGQWNVAANWNPQQVPGPGDRAFIVIDGTYAVIQSVPATVTDLIVGSPNFGTQIFSVQSTMNITGAGLFGTNGALYLQAGSL